jgi:predicted adenylyl cyclase CyaB
MSKQEIEIGFSLKNIEAVQKFLDKHGEFSYENNQIDTYFDSDATGWTKNVGADTPINFWLRVRQEGDTASINFKDFSSSRRADIASCVEFESIVNKPEDIKQILERLNFTPVIVVNKIRRAYRLRDIEIALDKVKDLGDYIEVEYYGELTDEDEIKKLLNSVIAEIGADVDEPHGLGYPHMLLLKKS